MLDVYEIVKMSKAKLLISRNCVIGTVHLECCLDLSNLNLPFMEFFKTVFYQASSSFDSTRSLALVHYIYKH